MSAVESLSCMPSSFEAGTTIRFTQGNTSFPATLWTAVLVLNNGVDAAVSIAGSANGANFDYVIPASTALKPGLYQWAEYFTAINPMTEKARGATGAVEVLSNLATTATPSFAQAQVTKYQTVLGEFASTTKLTVNFTGHSFTRASIKEYEDALTKWEARVVGEQNKAAIKRGEVRDGRVQMEFVRPTTAWPFGR